MGPTSRLAVSSAKIKLIKRMGLKPQHHQARPEHADLHMHSWVSDGFFSPTQLATAANFLGLKAVALTDHDTNAGQAEMQAACTEYDIEMVPGVELSTNRGKKVHILGYHMNFSHPKLMERMGQIQDAKAENIQKSIDNLTRADVLRHVSQGIELTDQAIRSVFPHGEKSQMHLAEVLRQKGHTDGLIEGYRMISDLFRIFRNAVTYPLLYFTVEEAVQLIHADGGIPIWAHPGNLRDRETLFGEFARQGLWGPNGLMGFEFVHGRDSEKATISLLAMIDALRTMGIQPILTIGSDYHDGNREKFGRTDLAWEVGRANDELAQLNRAREDKSSILI